MIGELACQDCLRGKLLDMFHGAHVDRGCGSSLYKLDCLLLSFFSMTQGKLTVWLTGVVGGRVVNAHRKQPACVLASMSVDVIDVIGAMWARLRTEDD